MVTIKTVHEFSKYGPAKESTMSLIVCCDCCITRVSYTELNNQELLNTMRLRKPTAFTKIILKQFVINFTLELLPVNKQLSNE